MQIFVKNGEKTMTLEVESSDTIRNVKAKIEEIEKICASTQQLTLRGKEIWQWQLLENESSLADYKIEDKSTVHLQVRFGGMTHILVKIFTGKTISLGVRISDSIQSLKLKIEEREGIPTAQQRLIYGGRELHDNDGCSLSDYGVGIGSHLLLAPPLPDMATVVDAEAQANKENLSSNCVGPPSDMQTFPLDATPTKTALDGVLANSEEEYSIKNPKCEIDLQNDASGSSKCVIDHDVTPCLAQLQRDGIVAKAMQANREKLSSAPVCSSNYVFVDLLSDEEDLPDTQAFKDGNPCLEAHPPRQDSKKRKESVTESPPHKRRCGSCCSDHTDYEEPKRMEAGLITGEGLLDQELFKSLFPCGSQLEEVVAQNAMTNLAILRHLNLTSQKKVTKLEVEVADQAVKIHRREAIVKMLERQVDKLKEENGLLSKGLESSKSELNDLKAKYEADIDEAFKRGREQFMGSDELKLMMQRSRMEGARAFRNSNSFAWAMASKAAESELNGFYECQCQTLKLDGFAKGFDLRKLDAAYKDEKLEVPMASQELERDEFSELVIN